ncbi:MAG: 50S ribosomal protein L10 [Anaerofustis sp.]
MSSGAILEQKKQIVSEIAGKMKEAQSFVIVNYKGINVANVTALRVKAREMGVEYKIYKNTFLRFAAKECGYDELVDCFEGTTAIAFSNADAVAPAKLIADFAKDNKLQTLDFIGGVIDKKVTDVESIQKISQLPSKEVLLAKMLGSLNAPIAKFAYALNAIKDQKSA